PYHARSCGSHLLQGLNRLFGTPFLNNPYHRIEYHDGQYYDRISSFTDYSGNDSGSDQDDDHEVRQLIPYHLPKALLFGRLDFVRAVFFEALAGRVVIKTRRVGIQASCNIVDSLQVIIHGTLYGRDTK